MRRRWRNCAPKTSRVDLGQRKVPMTEHSKVIWSEGILLRPQHFQQHDRYLESLINGRCLGLKPYDWGFFTLTINQELLKIGKLALAECQGIFPDGTPFNLPADDEIPLPL